jgi:hypothetical protein
MSPPSVDAARDELALLLRERASRVRLAFVVTGLVGGAGLLTAALAVDAPMFLVGGAGFLALALIVGAGLIPISGQGSQFRHDRIMYLQAYVAAHDASGQDPIPRQPRSSRSLPDTVDTIDTIRT